MSFSLKHICFADDDEDDRLFFKEALTDISSDIVLNLFKDGKELLEYILTPNIVIPNIVFLDLNMPLMNGMQCLAEMRKKTELNQVYVVIYSTSSSRRDIEKALANGANLYVKKPYSFSEIKDVIKKVLQLDWQNHIKNLSKNTFQLHI